MWGSELAILPCQLIKNGLQYLCGGDACTNVEPCLQLVTWHLWVHGCIEPFQLSRLQPGRDAFQGMNKVVVSLQSRGERMGLGIKQNSFQSGQKRVFAQELIDVRHNSVRAGLGCGREADNKCMDLERMGGIGEGLCTGEGGGQDAGICGGLCGAGEQAEREGCVAQRVGDGEVDVGRGYVDGGETGGRGEGVAEGRECAVQQLL